MSIYLNKTLEDKLYEKYGDKFFLILYPFALYTIITARYLYILVFDGVVGFTIILLKHKSNFLAFYYKSLSTIFWAITLSFSAISLVLFEQDNYLYMAKAYLECNILEIKDYSLVYRDEDSSTYMMRKYENIDENFKVIERLVGKINYYELIKDNKYTVIFKNNQEIDIEFNNYNQFTLFSLDTNLKN